MIAMLRKLIWLATLIVLAGASPANASVFKLSFTADQFVLGGSGNFEDDFVLIWDQALTPLLFQYSVASLPGIWDTSTFSRFDVTISSSAAEPGTLALLGFAIPILIPISRRKRSASTSGK